MIDAYKWQDCFSSGEMKETCMQAREEANEAGLNSLGDLGEDVDEEAIELREKKENVSLLGLRPPLLEEMDPRVILVSNRHSEASCKAKHGFACGKTRSIIHTFSTFDANAISHIFHCPSRTYSVGILSISEILEILPFSSTSFGKWTKSIFCIRQGFN